MLLAIRPSGFAGRRSLLFGRPASRSSPATPRTASVHQIAARVGHGRSAGRSQALRPAPETPRRGWIHQCWVSGRPQRTNNMRRYTASSPISKRYMYTPLATARPCSSRASQVRRCSPAWRVSAASTRTRWPVRL